MTSQTTPQPFTIWIDADACPVDARSIVFRASKRLGFSVRLVANSPTPAPSSDLIEEHIVGGGPDAADDLIAERCAPGDIVITSDIPLAARVVERDALAISPRGQWFDKHNAPQRLAVRDLMADLREREVIGGSGPAPYGPADKQRFAAALDRELARRARRRRGRS